MLQSQLINKRRDLDPDFGKGINEKSIVHLVTVQPAANHLEEYNLVVMLPNAPFANGGVDVIHYLMDMFLEPNDNYLIMAIPPNADIDKSVSIISYDPENPGEFFWITPPPHLWH